MTFDQCLEGLISIVSSFRYDEAKVRAIALIDEYFSANRHDIASEKDRLARELGDAAPDRPLKIVPFLQNYLVNLAN